MKNYLLILVAALIAFSWTACQPDDPVIELTEFYFTANIAGDSVIVIDERNVSAGLGFYADKDSIPVDGTTCIVSYFAQFRDISNLNQQAVFFTFNRYYEGVCANEPTDFRLLFQPESQPPADDESTRGWIFDYKDESGKVWQSTLGDQSGSSLEITSSEEIDDDTSFNFRRQKITGTLSCTLYDEAGASIEVRNARFAVYVASYDW